MKKVFLLTALSVILSFAAQAQIRIGGFLGFGTEVENPGLGINGEFTINDKVSISPNLLFYFPKKNGGVKQSVWELNGNVNYYFVSDNSFSFYGLAGLNVTNVKVKYNNFFGYDGSASDSELGLNLGIGANFTAGNILPFAEMKYTISDFDQLVIMAGIKFPLRN
jgi:outer membrane immunogenic protein